MLQAIGKVQRFVEEGVFSFLAPASDDFSPLPDSVPELEDATLDLDSEPAWCLGLDLESAAGLDSVSDFGADPDFRA